MKELVEKRIGFVSFRFAGTDGVSLETNKWAEVLTDLGWECFYLAGEFDATDDQSRCMIEPMLQFSHPDIQEIHKAAFGYLLTREQTLTRKIHDLRQKIKKRLYEFVNEFNVSTLIAENVLTIPLNLPLGLALTEFLAETGIKCIAHHHDFFWERKRFINNCVADILYSSYPPNLPNMAHAVINSDAQANLALRTGVTASLIPNVMPFERPAPGIDDYNADLRQRMNIPHDTLLVLQPTRVVQRKGIEHAIELVARMQSKLDREIMLLISHASGDEGFEYEQRIHEYADMLSVLTIFEDRIICDQRMKKDGQKCYSLNDVYPHADIVTYPSIFEGFGNAFLEAIYFHKMIVVNNYSVYAKDIKPHGFRVVEFDNFISSATVDNTIRLIDDEQEVKSMVEHNYRLATQHFSYQVLSIRLKYLLSKLWGSKFE